MAVLQTTNFYTKRFLLPKNSYRSVSMANLSAFKDFLTSPYGFWNICIPHLHCAILFFSGSLFHSAALCHSDFKPFSKTLHSSVSFSHASARSLPSSSAKKEFIFLHLLHFPIPGVCWHQHCFALVLFLHTYVAIPVQWKNRNRECLAVYRFARNTEAIIKCWSAKICKL